MPWLRTGDTFATHPLLMALVSVRGRDERTLNEVTGFITRLATQSSAHMTDYRVDLGTAELIGGSRTKILLRQAVEAGILTEHGTAKTRTWSIVEDTEFLHMPSRAETMRRRIRDRDRKNEDLTVPVRSRDGDECRYCGRIVNWFDRKGIKGGQFDHVDPGKAATIDTYVVCCAGCNKQWSDTDGDVKREHLRPAPSQPFFSEKTAEWLTARGVPTNPTPAQSESEQAGAASPERSSDQRPATARPHKRNTAAHARGSSMDDPTAATVRDCASETPQPPARASSWDDATAATHARPDFLSDNDAPPARPGTPPDTAATTKTHAGTHPPARVPAQRMEGANYDPEPNHDQQVTPRSEVWNPGRVGSGWDGPGSASGSAGTELCLPPSHSHHSVRSRRGKRGRKTKKG